MSRYCFLLFWLMTNPVSGSLAPPFQPTCDSDSASADHTITGDALLQTRSDRGASKHKAPESLHEGPEATQGIDLKKLKVLKKPDHPVLTPNLLHEGPEETQGMDQSCELLSPWLSNLPRRHDMSFENYEDGEFGLNGMFVWPPNNLAVCLIEKNGCTTWINSVLQPLLESKTTALCDDAELANGDDCLWRNGIRYDVAKESQKRFGRIGIEKVFHNPYATRVVFVRDPLERFVSAFLHKCVGDGATDHCLIPTGTTKFRDAVETALESNMSSFNSHWAPQVDHCHLRDRLSAYNVIGLMQEDTFGHDMNCVLAKAGLESFMKKSFGNPHPTVRTDKTHLTPTMVMQKLFPRDMALKLIDHLDDYEVLQFSKEPEWLEGATGEWYELDPTPTKSFFSFGDSKYEGNVNIAELAVRAGYTD